MFFRDALVEASGRFRLAHFSENSNALLDSGRFNSNVKKIIAAATGSPIRLGDTSHIAAS